MDLKPLPDEYVVDAADWLAIQTNAETADGARVTDLVGPGGVASGLDLTEQVSPDMTLQLSAGVAYDTLGRRLDVPSVQTVNLAADTEGTSTAVGSGQERYVAIYVSSSRTNADPYSLNGTTVYLTQTESYEILRVAGDSASSGTAIVPAAPTGNPVLLGRVLITHGMTAVRTNDVRLASVPLLHRNADLYSDSVARLLEVSTEDPPSMKLVVASGRVNLDGTHMLYAGGTTGTFTAPVSNPRIDLVALNSAGSLVTITGTEAATPTRPSTAGYLPIAFVSLAVGQTAITDGNIADARPWLQAQTARRRYYEATASASQTIINLPFTYVLGAHAIEVAVDGVVYAESQYTETNTSRITLGSALSGGEKITVRATQVAELEAVALEQVTDDLSGLLAGGDIAYEDRGATLKLYVSPIAMTVIQRQSYTFAGSATSLSAISANAWRYLYAYVSSGAIATEFSTTAPDEAKVWRDDGARTHRFLGAVRTDSGGIPLMFHRTGGVVLYDRSNLGASDLNALTGGTSNTWATVSLAGFVPPHARHVLVELEVTTGSGTSGGVELRSYGATGAGALTLTVEAISATTQTARREAWMLCDTLQRIEYERVSGYAGNVTIRVLGYRD